MLFLGLGTGLGSALIVDGVLEPMELAHLPYKKGGLTRIMWGWPDSSGLEKRNGAVMSTMSSSNSRRRWRLIMLFWAAAMRDCSRNFHPAAKSETTPTHFVAAFAFGPSLTAAQLISGSSINL